MKHGRRRYVDLPHSAERISREVDEEIAFDLEMRVRELVSEGMSEHAARTQAQSEFGDLEATRRYCADMDASAARSERWSRWLGELRQDCVLALRSVRATPAFAAVVLLSLAIGLGANTAIYSVVRRVLVDRLPYRDAGSLVRIAVGSGNSAGNGFVTPVELRDLATQPSLAGVAAFGDLGSINYYGADIAEPIAQAKITPNFFAVLGASPILGRTFGDGDVAPDAPAVVIISYDFWQQQLHGDSAVIGRAIRLRNGQRTVVGVMPREFVSPQFKAELWMPLNLAGALNSPNAARMRVFRGIARLRPGTTIARANSDAATLAARWRAEGVNQAKIPSPHFLPLRDAMVGDVRPLLVAVMLAALLVLVITCTNIAGLFLARATSRRREMAVRVALGAGRGRLVRQLLTETTLYGVAGGIVGVLIAIIVHPPLVRIANGVLPALGEIRIDWMLVATAIGVAAVCGAAVGIMPAITATRVDLRASMGDAARGASAGGDRVLVRQMLVASQIALAILLVVGAGLLLRSFWTAIDTPLGYSTEKSVLSFSMTAPEGLATGQEPRDAFFATVLERIRALPEARGVAMTGIAPWNGPNGVELAADGADNDKTVHAGYLTATEEYFSTIGTKVLRGRGIAATDRAGAEPVVLLSESTARELFGAADPIGRLVMLDPKGAKRDPGHRVVGVVEDYRPVPDADIAPSIYVSDWRENSSRWGTFIVRTSGDATRLIPSLRAIVRETNPESPLMYPRTLNEIMHASLAPQILSLGFFSLFALLALTLAALGVYGVMSYVVAMRTREFGIRTALGARREMLLRLVVRQSMRPATTGIVFGLVLAFWAARLMSKLLIGVTVHDPVTFVVAPAVLFGVTLLACAVPAWRASRVNPVDALRSE